MMREHKRRRRAARLALMVGAGLLAPLAGSAQSSPDALIGPPAPPVLTLWSRQPAVLDRPTSGVLPPFHTGNSLIGALVSGGVERERIRLLEPELPAYPGQPVKPLDEVEALPRLRELVAAGRNREAVALAEGELLSGTETRFAPQTLCELEIDHRPVAPVEEYRRELNLRTGIVTVSWREGETRHIRTVYADQMSGMLWLRWRTEGPGRISATMRFAPHAEGVVTSAHQHLILKGQLGRKGHTPLGRSPFFQSTVDGFLTSFTTGLEETRNPLTRKLQTSGTFLIQESRSLEMTLSNGIGATEKDAFNRSFMKTAVRLGVGEETRHKRVHWERMAGDTMGMEGAVETRQATDERLEAVRGGAEDPTLPGLLYQYGRYLKHASSLVARPPGRPRKRIAPPGEAIIAPR